MHGARDGEDTRLLEANEHARLLGAYYPVIVDRCRVRVRGGDADEVAHAVVERLLRELRTGKRYTVPFRVVVHKVIDWKLKEFFAGGSAVVRLEEELDAPGRDPFEEWEQEYDLDVLFGALPERAREVLRLRYLEGLEIEEIAARLGIERNAVDQALHRGHRALREQIRG